MPTTGHAASYVALICIMKAGKNCSPMKDMASPFVPILALAYEHDPEPEMLPYKDNIDAELRDKLILGISGAVTAHYRYFAHYAEGWRQATVQKDRPIAKQSKKSDGTILAIAVRAKNTNTAVGMPPCSRKGEALCLIQF